MIEENGRSSTGERLYPLLKSGNTLTLRRNSRHLPYLRRIKLLLPSYPSLRHLSDWMEVGTTPLRWPDIKRNPQEGKRRAAKTTLICMENGEEGSLRITPLMDDDGLKDFLNPPVQTSSPQSLRAPAQSLRVFHVEDLSSRVIQNLGSRFDMDPFFFRDHIQDETLGSGMQPRPRDLSATAKRRTWFGVQNVRLRHHPWTSSYRRARLESNDYNVSRRLEDAGRHWQDHQDQSVVSITRTRTTIWIGKDAKRGNDPVGIVLIDPTVTADDLLWHDRPNWLPLPDTESTSSDQLFTSSRWYTDIIQRSAAYPWFDPSVLTDAAILRRIDLPVFYTVCAEWFVACEYVRACLGQIEQDLDSSSVLVSRDLQINRALVRLSTWRRQVPFWREMVDETLEQSLPTAARLTSAIGAPQSNQDFDDITSDFKRVLHTLNELQTRIDRLSDRGNAEMQIAAARQGLTESHNLARLTWLATIFVPLTFMSGLFSMTDDLSAISGTFHTYYKVAIPLAVGSLLVARWGSVVFRFLAKVFLNMCRRLYREWIEPLWPYMKIRFEAWRAQRK